MNKFYCSIVLFGLLTLSGTAPSLNSRSIIIDRFGVNGKYYSTSSISKKDLTFLERNIWNRLPDSLAYFSFNMQEKDRQEIANCVTYVNELKDEFKKECSENGKAYSDADFGKYWIKKRESCYLRYLKLFPALYFDFNLPNESDCRLYSIDIDIYYEVQKLGSTENPYLNKEDLGKEVIILTHSRGKKEYFLSQKQDLSKKNNFVLELTMLTSDFRSDDPPRKYLLDIIFNFKIGSSDLKLSSKPFFLDL